MVPAEVTLRIDPFKHVRIELQQGSVPVRFFQVYLHRHQDEDASKQGDEQALEAFSQVFPGTSFSQCIIGTCP